jgi:hypothetical protein
MMEAKIAQRRPVKVFFRCFTFTEALVFLELFAKLFEEVTLPFPPPGNQFPFAPSGGAGALIGSAGLSLSLTAARALITVSMHSVSR